MSGEPIRTTTFLLTRADALAYEQAAGRMTPLGVIALICWLGLCGAAALLIPADWAGPRFGFASSLLVSIAVAIGYTLALILISLRHWLRARRRIRRPTEVTVSEWPDRLDLIGIGKLDPIPLNSIRRTISTRTHLLFEADQDVVILPRRAFVEDGALEELARKVEGIPRADAAPVVRPPDKPPAGPAPPAP
jgi:hypothetical protein